MMESKFDARTLRAWEEEIKPDESAKLDMFEFLKRRRQTLERIESRSADKKGQKKENSAIRVILHIKEVKRLKLCLNCLSTTT